MDTFLAVLFVIICALLIVVVLLQKGRGGGLSAAFGGGGHSAFGTRTGDVFTWVTIVLVGVFLLLAVVAALTFRAEAQPVDTPFFVPKPASIAGFEHVRIRCNTPRAKIYYTLTPLDEPGAAGGRDNTVPTRRSRLYDDIPVRVLPGQVLKARAFLRGWIDSEVAEGAYRRIVPTTATAPAGAKPAARAAGGR